jgi:hypothetical protein
MLEQAGVICGRIGRGRGEGTENSLCAWLLPERCSPGSSATRCSVTRPSGAESLGGLFRGWCQPVDGVEHRLQAACGVRV